MDLIYGLRCILFYAFSLVGVFCKGWCFVLRLLIGFFGDGCFGGFGGWLLGTRWSCLLRVVFLGWVFLGGCLRVVVVLWVLSWFALMGWFRCVWGLWFEFVILTLVLGVVLFGDWFGLVGFSLIVCWLD